MSVGFFPVTIGYDRLTPSCLARTYVGPYGQYESGETALSLSVYVPIAGKFGEGSAISRHVTFLVCVIEVGLIYHDF